MSDKRVEAAVSAIADFVGRSASTKGDYDVARLVIEVADAADDHVRVPREVAKNLYIVAGVLSDEYRGLKEPVEALGEVLFGGKA